MVAVRMADVAGEGWEGTGGREGSKFEQAAGWKAPMSGCSPAPLLHSLLPAIDPSLNHTLQPPSSQLAAMPPKRDAGGSCRTVGDVQAKLDAQAGRSGPPHACRRRRRSPCLNAHRHCRLAFLPLQVQQLETLLSTGEKKVKNLGQSFSNSIFKRSQARRGWAGGAKGRRQQQGGGPRRFQGSASCSNCHS